MTFPGPFAFQPRPPALRDSSNQTSSQVEPAPASEEKPVTETTSVRNKNSGADAVNPHNFPPLILAAHQGDLAKLDRLLQEPSVDINQIHDGVSALVAAVAHGDVAVVARLIAAGVDLTLRYGKTRRTALMWASAKNKSKVVECLLAVGAQVNLADHPGLQTALIHAAADGHLAVVNLLLAHKDIAIDQTDATGMTALHFAAANNQPEVVAGLLAAGARPNLAEDGKRLTALMKASWKGHADVVKALLTDKRTAVDQIDASGVSALHWAADANHPVVVARLLAAGANGNLAGGLHRRTPLATAVVNGHGDVVKTLLTHKSIAVDLIDVSGQTALHCAATGNKPEMVACLLATGANVSLKNGGGDAALILAVKNGHLDVVKTLLAHKDIAVDQADSAGMNALHWAAFQNKPEIVVCLLQAGARVNMLDGWQRRTALILASGAGHVDVVKRLLGHRDLALNVVDSSNWSALHLAAYGNKLEVAECLLAAGANVNLLRQSSRTALMLAAEYGHVDVVKLLIRYKGFNARQIDATGQTALHIAVACNKPDVVACLLAAGADLKLANGVGMTADMFAILNKQAAVLEAMMQYGLALPPHDFSDPAHTAFHVTMSDLESTWKPPVALFLNPLTKKFLEIPARPLFFIDDLVARVESGMSLLTWLRQGDVRTASALPVVECVASLAELWPKLSNSGKAASTHQKRLICAAALNMLPVLTADGKALAHYKAAGISAAGVANLSTVATHQIDVFIGVAESVLTTLGNAMVNELVQACMAASASASRVDVEALCANLVDAGWLAPVARPIAMSWQSALAALKAVPAALPASSSITPASTSWRGRVEREAPRLFAQALSREFDSQSLVAALHKLIGDSKAAEPIDILFQAQCDQLRQFCEQTNGEG